MDWSLRHAIFIGRSFRTYHDTLLVWEWKIYYSGISTYTAVVSETVRRNNWRSDISLPIWRYLSQFIYSCQLHCYYYHTFVTFWSRKSQNHSLNSVWIAYATTTETYTRKSDPKLVGLKGIITKKNYCENPMLPWWWMVIQS